MTISDGNITAQPTSIVFRTPRPEDGAALWQLVKATGQLEPNTPYCYLLLATDFSDTCVVAQSDGRLVGTVLGYHPPREPDTAFVWQVGVLPERRGQGLGLRLLQEWLALPANRECNWLTATVADDNPASQALFRRLAAEAGCGCEVSPRFTEDLFPQAHPPEPVYRIGPLSRQSIPLI